jgi:hypothetical protein
MVKSSNDAFLKNMPIVSDIWIMHYKIPKYKKLYSEK